MPRHLSNTTDDIWSNLEFILSEFRDLLHMRLETKEEAVGKRISAADPKKGKKAVWRDTAPRWEDPALGISVPPWLMIRYVDAIDQDELRDLLEAGKRLLPTVEHGIAAKELTPEFLRSWGLINRICGAVELIYQTEPDIGRLREASGNLEAHRRWFADYFLRAYTHGKLEETRDQMERFINSIFSELPEGTKRDWFGRFLSNEPSERWGGGARRLTGAFREDLSVKEMRRLAKQPAVDVPSLDLDFPPP